MKLSLSLGSIDVKLLSVKKFLDIYICEKNK